MDASILALFQGCPDVSAQVRKMPRHQKEKDREKDAGKHNFEEAGDNGSQHPHGLASSRH